MSPKCPYRIRFTIISAKSNLSKINQINASAVLIAAGNFHHAVPMKDVVGSTGNVLSDLTC